MYYQEKSSQTYISRMEAILSDPKITILKNGSLRVEGEIPMEDHEGTSVTIPVGKPYHLCRCGVSQKKPFCDGRHKVCDFDGTLL